MWSWTSFCLSLVRAANLAPLFCTVRIELGVLSAPMCEEREVSFQSQLAESTRPGADCAPASCFSFLRYIDPSLGREQGATELSSSCYRHK